MIFVFYLRIWNSTQNSGVTEPGLAFVIPFSTWSHLLACPLVLAIATLHRHAYLSMTVDFLFLWYACHGDYLHATRSSVGLSCRPSPKGLGQAFLKDHTFHCHLEPTR